MYFADMNNSLAHLPQNKQDDLQKVTSIIRARCTDVEMVILFGSYARGDYKEEKDLAPIRKSGHVSDYDILVVTKEKSTAFDVGLWKRIEQECAAAGLSTHVRIIAADIQGLNIQLAERQYFYTDVKKEGCLLFDSGKFALAEKRKLTADERRRIAQDYFDHWFERAQRFFYFAETAVEKEWWKEAAFNLHQSTEVAYKTILLVSDNCNPNEHYLYLLNDMTAKIDHSLESIFPQQGDDKYELFEKLDYAYIGARYDPDYRIDKEELEFLAPRVKRLLDITEEICKEKIDQL